MMITKTLALISTICIVSSAIVMAFGWREIRRGNRERHQKIMLTSAVLALIFFIIYMSRTIIFGNINFAGPAAMQLPYHLFLIFHIILATVGGIFGLVMLYLAFKEKFAVHRKIGPYTATIWFCTAITGIAVYILLFVLWPGGEEDSLIKTILGF